MFTFNYSLTFNVSPYWLHQESFVVVFLFFLTFIGISIDYHFKNKKICSCKPGAFYTGLGNTVLVLLLIRNIL